MTEAASLDHVLIAVDDLDSAATTYEMLLGRPVAVRSEHPRYGTRNALFIFESGPYLELLALQPAIAGPAAGATLPPAALLSDFLRSRGPGLYGVAIAPRDLDGAVAALRQAGVALDDPAEGTGVSPDGRVRTWRNTRLPAAALHGSGSLLIEHSGWDWRTDLRRPPLPGREASAARRVDHAVFAVADADAAAERWQRWFGVARAGTIAIEGGTIAVMPMGGPTVELIGPAGEGRFATLLRARGEHPLSLSIEVGDLDAAVAAVRAAGGAVTDPATGVLPRTRIARVDPASACGVALQLLERR